MQTVEEKMEHIKSAYEKSILPDRPDVQIAESLLVQIRNKFIKPKVNPSSLSIPNCGNCCGGGRGLFQEECAISIC